MLRKRSLGTTLITYGEYEVDLGKPWIRLSMSDAVKQATGLDYTAWTSDEEARAAAASVGVHVAEDATRGKVLSELFEEKVEETLIQPTFTPITHQSLPLLAARKAILS